MSVIKCKYCEKIFLKIKGQEKCPFCGKFLFDYVNDIFKTIFGENK